METVLSKVIELGKVDGYHRGRKDCAVDVRVEIRDYDGFRELTISGSVWNTRHTDIIAGGQNWEEILSYFPDSIKVGSIVRVWQRWHLNGMRSGCEHQRALGWTWTTHPSEPCPDCGYRLGTAWLREELPQEVIDTVRSW